MNQLIDVIIQLQNCTESPFSIKLATRHRPEAELVAVQVAADLPVQVTALKVTAVPEMAYVPGLLSSRSV